LRFGDIGLRGGGARRCAAKVGARKRRLEDRQHLPAAHALSFFTRTSRSRPVTSAATVACRRATT